MTRQKKSEEACSRASHQSRGGDKIDATLAERGAQAKEGGSKKRRRRSRVCAGGRQGGEKGGWCEMEHSLWGAQKKMIDEMKSWRGEASKSGAAGALLPGRLAHARALL